VARFDGRRVTLPAADELQRRASDLLATWRVLDTSIVVAWNGRLSTTAGRAFVRKGRVELNPRLLARAPEQVLTVLTHETAHVATFRLFGANVPAHGRHWRALMRHVGHEPAVTHRIPVRGLRRSRRSFHYLRFCEACGDRVIHTARRFGRCHGCSARDSFLFLRAPATAQGLAALQRLTPAEVRAAFG
jgi:predicted SprT family Zn-dependent metalloprotease